MDLKALVQRLNPVCFRALEQAAERSRAQGHWFVEPAHLLLALLDDEHCDLAYCLSSAAISVDKLREEIRSTQAQFKSGCTRMPVFSVQLLELLEGAVLLAAFQRRNPANGHFSVVAASLTHPRTSARPVGARDAAAVAAPGGNAGKPVAELVSWLR